MAAVQGFREADLCASNSKIETHVFCPRFSQTTDHDIYVAVMDLVTGDKVASFEVGTFFAVLHKCCVGDACPQLSLPRPSGVGRPAEDPAAVDGSHTSNQSTMGQNLNDTLEVTVNEWSEDAGIAVRAIWYLDYLPPKMTYLNNRDYAPGHLDDAKVLDITWQVIIAAPACSTFTLLVTHVDNDSNDLNHTPINPDDVATITWWLSSNDTDSTSPVALSSCPKSGEATP